MLGYKDMTFCTFYKKCVDGKVCGRALTPRVRRDAVRWWGDSSVPIIHFAVPPKCFKKIEVK